jgi:TRIAD3 protein (E3 ubiquitin-protein ligase RNF216)
MDMSGCESFFSRDQLEKSLDEKVMKKYDELQTTLMLKQAGIDDLCKCPKCDFQASLPESEMIFQCPFCEFESCRKCREVPHIPLRCEEVKRKTETSARLQVEEAMTKARIHYCPKNCKQGFYKVSIVNASRIGSSGPVFHNMHFI